MAPSKTRTVKNKHATNKSGISGSKSTRKAPSDGIVKSKKPKGTPPAAQNKKRKLSIGEQLRRRKKEYTEEDLGIPKLNMITPVGVEKPKGKKKGKVFADDRESMSTILAIVQAEKDGQIESKMIKARQMEEIREARRIESEKKDEERKSKFEDTKDSLRKKRKRTQPTNDDNIKSFSSAGTRASKPKKKRVSFA